MLCYCFLTVEAAWGIRKTKFTPENGKMWVFTWLGKNRTAKEQGRKAGTPSNHCPDQHFGGLLFLSFSFFFPLVSSRLLWSLWISDLWSFTNLLCSSKATYTTGARAGGQMLAHCLHLSPASPAKKTRKRVHTHTHGLWPYAWICTKLYETLLLLCTKPPQDLLKDKRTQILGIGPSTSTLKDTIIAYNI